jgi:hypothetical protein
MVGCKTATSGESPQLDVRNQLSRDVATAPTPPPRLTPAATAPTTSSRTARAICASRPVLSGIRFTQSRLARACDGIFGRSAQSKLDLSPHRLSPSPSADVDGGGGF